MKLVKAQSRPCIFPTLSDFCSRASFLFCLSGFKPSAREVFKKALLSFCVMLSCHSCVAFSFAVFHQESLPAANHTLICCGTNLGSLINEQTRCPGRSRGDRGLWFVCFTTIRSLNTHLFFLSFFLFFFLAFHSLSLYISLCFPVRRKVGLQSEKQKCDFCLSTRCEI